jgi:hypothetical protein
MAKPLIGVITNPNSKKNRFNPGRYDTMRQLVGDIGLVKRTHHTGEIADVVREFLDAGVPYWLADGGDGAFHWLVNVLEQVLEERGHKGPLPAIMPTNAGTIDFIGRKAGVVGHTESLIVALGKQLRAGETPQIVTLDSLRVRGLYGPDADFPGKPFDKIGFATALAGAGQRVFDKFYAQQNQSGLGVIQVVAKTLLSSASQSAALSWVPLPVTWRHFSDTIFEPQPLDVWVDGEQKSIKWYRDLDVGSIDLNIAGVFRFFPCAAEPGVLHVQGGDVRPWEVARNLPAMSTGGPLNIQNYFQGPAKHVRVVARDGRTLDPVIDGELYYGLVQATVEPGPPVRVVVVKGE